MEKILFITFIMTIAFLFTNNLWSTTYYVSNTGSDHNLGTETAPFEHIQFAIDNLQTGGEIIVEEGTYDPTVLDSNIDLVEDLYIHSRFDVNSPNSTYYIEYTIISAGTIDTAIDIYSCDTNDFQIVIEGFSIKDGHYVNTNNQGHGVKAQGSSISLKLNYNFISNNTSSTRGAGISCILGDFEIINNKIFQNLTETQGGGISIDSAVAIISNNEIYSNTAVYYGGGIGCFGCGNSYREYDVEILENSIHDNTSNRGGGIGILPDHHRYLISDNDIYENDTVNIWDNGQIEYYAGGAGINIAGNTHAINNRIVNNTSEYAGGGVVCGENEFTNTIFDECLILENIAAKGGGIYYESGKIEISNCTIIDNDSSISGGAINIDCEFSNPYDLIHPVIQNCILYGNQANNTSNQINITNDSSIVDEIELSYTCLDGNITEITGSTSDLVSSDIFDLDPRFVDYANNDFTLSNNSPCIDVGNPSSNGIDIDLDEDGTRKDVGCYSIDQDLITYNRTLRTGWNWLCFPRLKRVDYVNNNVILPTFGTGKFIDPLWIDTVSGFAPYSINGNDPNPPIWLNNHWVQNSFVIESIEGFKLNMSGTATESQVGALDSPYTKIQLTNLDTRPSYIGYILAEPGLITEVVPQGMLQYEFQIQAQNWCATYDPTSLGGNCWKFDTTSEPVIKCGQMIALKMLAAINGEFVFQWREPQTTRVDYVERPMPEYFSFVEQEDYLPVFLELDCNNLPQEIGLFINGICKGAAVVNQNQTEEAICQINAYVMEETSDNFLEELDIVYYYESRNTIMNYNKFAVYNQQNSEYYNQSLILADVLDKDQITISMRGCSYEESPEAEFEFRSHNYPNPFNPITDIYFSLPTASNAILDIYNIKGQRVKTLVNGQLDEGEHKITWDGTDSNCNQVSSGIYFYRLQSGKKVINKKMMLLK